MEIQEIQIETNGLRGRGKYTPEELREIRVEQGRKLAARRKAGEFNKPLSTWKQLREMSHKYGIRQSINGKPKSKDRLKREIIAIMRANGEDISEF